MKNVLPEGRAISGETLDIVEIREILRLLPHRYPFVMVDRIIDICGDEFGIGIKNVTINEPQFLGHFLAYPVMPGVLVIEGMAQTAAVLVLRLRQLHEARSMFFLTIDKAKFRRPAVPGDRLEYHVRKLKNRRTMWWYRAEAKIGSVLIAEAELGAMFSEVGS
jgi:3-hydroxyacyl-[acyl-carrier-protein] dehydratase